MNEHHRLRTDAAALRRLNEFSAALWQTDGLQHGLDKIVAAAIELLGADFGNVQLFDSKDGALRIAAHRGLTRRFLKYFDDVSAKGTSACERALQTGRRIVIEDVERDGAFAPHLAIARSAGYRAVQFTPLLARDATRLGMISTYFRLPHRLKEIDIELLDLYARQAAAFIERCRLEQALREKEEKLYLAVDAAGAATWSWNAKTNEVWWDDRFHALYGLPPEQRRTYETWVSRLHQGDKARVLAEIEKARRNRSNSGWDIDFRAVRPDGTVVWHHSFGHALRDEKGRLLRLNGILTDITARKEAEGEVREQRDTAQRYLDLAGVILVALDSAGKVTLINRKGCEMLGDREEKIIGQSWFERFVPLPHRRRTLKVFKQILAGKMTLAEFNENPVLTRNGTERLVAWKNRALTDGKGRIIGTLSSGEDITERRKAEVALEKSENHFRQVVESLPQLVWTCAPDGPCDYLSPQWVRYTGIPAPEQLGYGWLRQLHPEDRARVRARWQETASKKQNLEIEFRIRRYDGIYRWFRTLAVPLRDERGRIVKWFGSNTDIDSMKHAEQQREQALAEFNATVSCMTDGVMVFKTDGSMSYMNPAVERMLHCPPEACSWSRARWFKHLAISREDGTPFLPKDSLALRALRGETVAPVVLSIYIPHARENLWVLSSAAPMRTATGECIGAVAIFANITEQRRAVHALREREERIRAILNTVLDAVITIDRHGTIVTTNPAAERMFRYTGAEMVGRNVKMLMPSPYREEHDGYLKNFHQTGVKKIGAGRELQAQRKDGTVFPIEVSVSEVDHMQLFTGVVRDISARKELERAVSEAIEREQNRIGQDLHDGICQELAGIELQLCTLARRLQSAPMGEAEVRQIAASVRHAILGTRRLAHGLSPLISEPEGLMGALRELARNISRTFGIECHFQCKSPVLLKDTLAASHLYRIAQEAVSNSIRHGKADVVRISLSEDQEVILLSIKDDGIGLPSTPLGGAGLGLRIMKYRAGLINASFAIDRLPEGGTAVTCTLSSTPRRRRQTTPG